MQALELLELSSDEIRDNPHRIIARWIREFLDLVPEEFRSALRHQNVAPEDDTTQRPGDGGSDYMTPDSGTQYDE